MAGDSEKFMEVVWMDGVKKGIPGTPGRPRPSKRKKKKGAGTAEG